MQCRTCNSVKEQLSGEGEMWENLVSHICIFFYGWDKREAAGWAVSSVSVKAAHGSMLQITPH